MPREVMAISPFESSESSLEKDAKLFIQEEDELGETLELPKDEVPPKPPVELKPLPAGLRHVFLNSNKETPVVMSFLMRRQANSLPS